MKHLFSVILISLMFGCCPKIIPVSTTTIITHDTIIKIIVRDSIIKVPGKEVVLNNSVNCDSLNKAQMKKQTRKTNGVTATAEIRNGNLIVVCQVDALKLAIKIKEKRISILEKQLTQTVNNIEVHKPKWYDIMFRWWALITVICLALFFRKRINFNFGNYICVGTKINKIVDKFIKIN